MPLVTEYLTCVFHSVNIRANNACGLQVAQAVERQRALEEIILLLVVHRLAKAGMVVAPSIQISTGSQQRKWRGKVRKIPGGLPIGATLVTGRELDRLVQPAVADALLRVVASFTQGAPMNGTSLQLGFSPSLPHANALWMMPGLATATVALKGAQLPREGTTMLVPCLRSRAPFEGTVADENSMEAIVWQGDRREGIGVERPGRKRGGG